MTKYIVECRDCNKELEIQLTGKSKNRNYMLEKWDWYCENCNIKRFQIQNEKSGIINREAGLSQLHGTEKQIAWAETIRLKIISNLENLDLSGLEDADEVRKVIAEIKTRTAAAWWIDNRFRERDPEALIQQEYETMLRQNQKSSSPFLTPK